VKFRKTKLARIKIVRPMKIMHQEAAEVVVRNNSRVAFAKFGIFALTIGVPTVSLCPCRWQLCFIFV
jgi:hypothetical protein